MGHCNVCGLDSTLFTHNPVRNISEKDVFVMRFFRKLTYDQNACPLRMINIFCFLSVIIRGIILYETFEVVSMLADLRSSKKQFYKHYFKQYFSAQALFNYTDLPFISNNCRISKFTAILIFLVTEYVSVQL